MQPWRIFGLPWWPVLHSSCSHPAAPADLTPPSSAGVFWSSLVSLELPNAIFPCPFSLFFFCNTIYFVGQVSQRHPNTTFPMFPHCLNVGNHSLVLLQLQLKKWRLGKIMQSSQVSIFFYYYFINQFSLLKTLQKISKSSPG